MASKHGLPRYARNDGVIYKLGVFLAATRLDFQSHRIKLLPEQAWNNKKPLSPTLAKHEKN